MNVSVIIPTYNPNQARLEKTLAALRAQTLPQSDWESLIVNNASTVFPSEDVLRQIAPSNFRLVREDSIGLSRARSRGLKEARGTVLILVDDDNVLAPDYLEKVLTCFDSLPHVGIIGGRSLPVFESPPEPWMPEFFSLLALRDLGEKTLVSSGFRSPKASRNEYPVFAPIGAGMALRADVAALWLKALESDPNRGLLDRRGSALTSGGDNDIVMTAMEARWEVAYCPELSLQHLIPSSRLNCEYLARLNYSIQKSWMQVLHLHDANPWPRISKVSCELRRIKAWFRHRPWASPAARVRFAGDCGHFVGRCA